jgi:hypothetical protein
MASLKASLVIQKQHTGSSSIGNGMETARYPFESPAMHRDPVRAITYTPTIMTDHQSFDHHPQH